MTFLRKIDQLDKNAKRYAVVGPRGAMSLTVHRTEDRIIGGDVSYHIPCFDRHCTNTMEHGECDLFGEAFCHGSGRSIAVVPWVTDDKIFEYLERLYEVDVISRIPA